MEDLPSSVISLDSLTVGKSEVEENSIKWRYSRFGGDFVESLSMLDRVSPVWYLFEKLHNETRVAKVIFNQEQAQMPPVFGRRL